MMLTTMSQWISIDATAATRKTGFQNSGCCSLSRQHIWFPIVQFHQVRSSKLASYHFGFRNSLMLHSMPLSYGFTNLTSKSDWGCSLIWNSGYFFQFIWKTSPFSYKKQLTRRRPAIDEERVQSMGNLKLPTHLSWCWSRCNICATSRTQSARAPPILEFQNWCIW